MLKRKNENENEDRTADIKINTDNKKSSPAGKTITVFKKKLNYNIGYMLLIIAVTVVFVVVNVILELLPMSADLTENEQFSITDETEAILDGLDEEVEIIALYDRVRGMADTQRAEVIRILDLYDAHSNVSVSYVSLNDNPNIINEKVGQATAAAYSEGDYIVKSSIRTKRIASSDMFETSTEYISNIIPVTYATGNKTELQVSTAIKYVTLKDIPNLYLSEGLGEESTSLYSKIFEDIDNMNIRTQSINLSQVESIPEDADAILFLSPKRDLSATEYDILRQWLSYGGTALFVFDSDKTAVSFERFNMLLSELYGMSINNDIVSDESAYQIAAAASNYVITASPLNSEGGGPFSVNALDEYTSYFSRSIKMLNTSGYFESYPMIQTSSSAVSTEYITGNTNTGVATLAACGEYYANAKNSRAVIMGSSLGLTDENIRKYEDTASELTFLYSIDWMIGEDTMEPLSIKTRNYTTTQLVVDNTQSNWMFIFSVIIYPLAIIGVGVFIWIRRRHL